MVGRMSLGSQRWVVDPGKEVQNVDSRVKGVLGKFHYCAWVRFAFKLPTRCLLSHILPYMMPTLWLSSSISKVLQVNLLTQGLAYLTVESISHLPLMPYCNPALLQPSLGLFSFCLPSPVLLPMEAAVKQCRAISKRHCWGSCLPPLLSSHLTQLSCVKQGRGPRTPGSERAVLELKLFICLVGLARIRPLHTELIPLSSPVTKSVLLQSLQELLSCSFLMGVWLS